jgi:hypothetical protein
VYDPPAPPLDDNLAVGGVPSTRSILRFALPKFVTDSGQVIRATLDLIPVTAPQGVPADSFGVAAHAVVTDFGAKSPLDPVHVDTTVVHIGVTDTVHINVTNILRLWVANSQAPNTMVLRQVPEGAFFAEGRYYSSRDPSRMPLLRLTFAPRFPFGKR